MSPVSSVYPSARNVGVTDPFVVPQVKVRPRRRAPPRGANLRAGQPCEQGYSGQRNYTFAKFWHFLLLDKFQIESVEVSEYLSLEVKPQTVQFTASKPLRVGRRALPFATKPAPGFY